MAIVLSGTTGIDAGSLPVANTGKISAGTGLPVILNTAGIDRVTVDTSGNVGIGTSSPISKLSISGYLNSQDSNNNGALYLGQYLNGNGAYGGFEWNNTAGILGLRTQGAYPITFATNNTERVRLDANGNVGIGTNSPTDGTIHVNSSGATNTNIKFTNSSTGTTANDGMYVGIGADGKAYIYQRKADNLIFGTNNTNRMIIDSGGRVTMPYQPSFSATAPVSTFTPPNNVYTGYTLAITNVGNYYNTSNSRFTAPVAGVYYFWHQASARTVSSATYEIKLYKNTSIELSRVFNNGAGYGHGGIATAIVYLNAGDYVEAGFYNQPGVVFSGGEDLFNGNTQGIVTGWGGYLIG